jgi:hypothetical protein
MKNKKALNSFDAQVEQLISEFSKIPNFNLTSTDETASRVFNTIAYRLSDIVSYRNLVCQHFIPATNRAILEGKREFQNSRYKSLLNPKDIDFSETLHDTIRLAYVGLFHKLENYVNDIATMTELIFGEVFTTEGTVVKWAEDKFKFKIRDWQQFYTTHKINWICNCVKHKDGYPVKVPKPVDFMFADETQRIKLTPEQFRKDCDELIKLYPIYLQMVFLFAQHKMMIEEFESSPSMSEELIKKIKEFEENIQRCVNLFKGTKT